MQRGDRVRDKANLGGVIVMIQGESAFVHWSTGNRGWIKLRWLRKE